MLRQLGFSARGDAPVYLDQISGAVVRYDAHMQTLALDVPLDQLTLPTTVLSQPQTRAPASTASSDDRRPPGRFGRSTSCVDARIIPVPGAVD
ncbi:hypothetical protein VM57_06230 [Stenotrophomonas maltophilia]|uniref:Uncharacterized protein n=1 Tax=Stenotrophomonas maltophilia TaxID=40324 RepID=A0A0F5ZP73_STEMA|nr:hypothetical protein VM57_06230 [Stenotrophomonas maltophilia]